MSDDVSEEAWAANRDLFSGHAVVDTPTHRATINELAVKQLEEELDNLRERRMAIREKVEKAAKVKTEKADLTPYLKYEKLLKAVRKKQEKLDKFVAEQEADVHKLRALVIEMGVE